MHILDFLLEANVGRHFNLVSSFVSIKVRSWLKNKLLALKRKKYGIWNKDCYLSLTILLFSNHVTIKVHIFFLSRNGSIDLWCGVFTVIVFKSFDELYYCNAQQKKIEPAQSCNIIFLKKSRVSKVKKIWEDRLHSIPSTSPSVKI